MANTKLTDAQRVVLAAAGARDSGLVLPLPKSLSTNRGTHAVIFKSLIERALIDERPARPGEEVWRESDEHGRTTLVISAQGLTILGIDPGDQNNSRDTEAGVGADDGGTALHQPPPDIHSEEYIPAPQQGQHGKVGVAKPAGPQLSGAPVPAEPRPGTKLGALIAALKRPDGATIPDLMEATGWQAHSVRGAMSGNLKKKLGFSISSEIREGRGRVYRLKTETESHADADGAETRAGADTPDEGAVPSAPTPHDLKDHQPNAGGERA